MILLDTSVLIELFRTKDKGKTLFYKLAKKEQVFAISSITHYEILIGSNDMQNEFWDNLFSALVIIPFDALCSTSAVNIYKDLKSKSKMIELADLAIAATALANNIELATLNTKHFSHIKDLKINS